MCGASAGGMGDADWGGMRTRMGSSEWRSCRRGARWWRWGWAETTAGCRSAGEKAGRYGGIVGGGRSRVHGERRWRGLRVTLKLGLSASIQALRPAPSQEGIELSPSRPHASFRYLRGRCCIAFSADTTYLPLPSIRLHPSPAIPLHLQRETAKHCPRMSPLSLPSHT